MAIQTARLKWNGRVISDRMRHATADAILVGMEYLLTEANKTVPLDESMLEKSGTSSVDERALVGAVSYDTPYAARQHEDLTYRHTPGRRAKWLELTLVEDGPTALAVIATQIRRRTVA